MRRPAIKLAKTTSPHAYESRMVSAVSEGAVVVSNAYDYLSRRVRKEVYAWDTQLTTYRLQSTAHYVWDGWNIAAEIVVDSVAASTNVHFYTWGLDLSGTVQGAGGVGGLLADTTCNKQPVTCNTYFPCYDANGNVTDYVDASGNLRARYAYSAFGETTAQSGDMAGAFTHRFSTKPFDAATGVSKYQLRDYLPGLGRWASRDPIGEEGGAAIYAFIRNRSVTAFDLLGRKELDFVFEFVPRTEFTWYENPPLIAEPIGKNWVSQTDEMLRIIVSGLTLTAYPAFECRAITRP